MSRRPNLSPHYEVLAELGRGTTGVVYKALCVPLKRIVALKTPLLDSPPERTARLTRLLREARVLAALTGNPDPHFPTLHAVVECQGQPYLSREFMEGCTLEQMAAVRALGLREGVAVLAAVGRAVHRVHHRGLAHRNLHPSNVLIGPGNAPKLIGFGLVGLLDGSALLPPGRPGASPEVDVRALQGMLDWLCSALGVTLPASLQTVRQPGSVISPGAFAEALESWTHGDS